MFPIDKVTKLRLLQTYNNGNIKIGTGKHRILNRKWLVDAVDMLRKKLRLSNSQEISYEGNQTIESKSSTDEVELSKYFNTQDSSDIPTKLLQIATNLNDKLRNLRFNNPVNYVYNPVEYAFDMFAAFTQKYCKTEKKIILLGMNPGPFGMVQTGIPFGEINMVKDWYKIEEKIKKPAIECPEREVMGLKCPRSEISGKRLFEFFKNISSTPEIFFQYTYLYNFCPLALMEKGGRNITPASLKGPVKKELEEHCSATFNQVLELLKPEIIITLGRYVDTQVKIIFKKHDITNIKVIYMPHPSPRAVGNENWSEKAQKVLEDNNLLDYFIPK